MANKNNFISNNVKCFQSIKRLKLIKYFKDKIVSNGFLFLQETHSVGNGEIKWKYDFKRKVFYSHGKSNSCGGFICFLGFIRQ